MRDERDGSLWGEGAERPSVVVDAGMHAREWLSPAAALYFVQELVSGSSGGVVGWDVWVLPVLNPDGYVYSRRGGGQRRFWRKTRSRASHTGRRCLGVDLNRNFDHNWGHEILSRWPCDETYAGPDAFSEAEGRALKALVEEVRPALYLSLHAYGQLLLSPWGWSQRPTKDAQDQANLAAHALAAIKAATNGTYEHGTIARDMYAASGTSVDYFYSQGLRFPYAMELRPSESDPRGFLVGPAEIIQSGKEVTAAVFAMTKALDRLTPQGRVPPPPIP